MFDEIKAYASLGAAGFAALCVEQKRVCEADSLCAVSDQVPDSSFSVYALRDPLTPDLFQHADGAVFYVGQTGCLHRRFLDHVDPCAPKNQSLRKRKRVDMIQSVGQSPRLELLNRVSSRKRAFKVERMWIAYFRGMGYALTNGGHQMRGCKFAHCLEPDALAENSTLSALAHSATQIMLQCLECCHMEWRDPKALIKAGYPQGMSVAEYRASMCRCEHCGSGAIIAGVEGDGRAAKSRSPSPLVLGCALSSCSIRS
jgi:hypothetical protein